MHAPPPPAGDPDRHHDGAMPFGAVLRDELAAIVPGGAPPAADDNGEAAAEWIDARAVPLSALCLSGGGIRSASFALGALQALARAGVLGQFDYLSTVSGGGYIGAWLTAWRKHAGDDAKVFTALNLLTVEGRDPAEIAALRANSNYLTPRYGILSADTWAVVAHYLRNLVLNWLVFGAFFLSLLVIPQLCARLLSELAAQPEGWRIALQWAGGVLLACGLSVAVCGRLRTRGAWLTDTWYLRGVLAPVIAASMCLAGAVRMPQPPSSWYRAALVAAAVYAVAVAAGRVLAWKLPGQPVARARGGSGWTALAADGAAWIISGAVAGILAWAGGLIAAHVREATPLADRDAILTIFAAVWIVLCVLAGELLYTGITSYSPRGDMDQEWLARSAGWMAAVSASWAVIAALDIYGPFILAEAHIAAAALLAGGVTGVVAVVFGSGVQTAATVVGGVARRLSLQQLVSVAAIVFAAFLGIILSWVDARICAALFAWLGEAAAAPGFPGPGSVAMFVLAAALLALALGLSIPINVNRFSLHAVYRNRLIRTFLGAARNGTRKGADPFTGFDPADNVTLAETRTPAQHCLFHVVNVALNVVSSRRLAWQERKAEAFSLTPLACGNPHVGYRPSAKYGDPRGGISLGTAMAISGAAVSPNQGYHSSPLVGFLLMLFNVRLGWWLGNPRHAWAARQSGPSVGLLPALEELAGATDDRRSWVYLSDGGHFDNLGIYEMVRRHCRLIVASDAGCDPATGYEDLGNTVRKCLIDFGVRITFDVLDIPARPPAGRDAVYCAVGRIDYPRGAPGWLLYVKPAYHGNEAADIRSYALANPSFPHETTTDQWFSESQFESYRALGAHIFSVILQGDGAEQWPLDMYGLKRAAQAYVDTTLGRCAEAEIASLEATGETV